MRFLKYLIFIIITICSTEAFSSYYLIQYPSQTFSTAIDACRSRYPETVSVQPQPTSTQNGACKASNGGDLTSVAYKVDPEVCPEVGYPMYVYFDAGSAIPQQRCQPTTTGSKFCLYKSKPDSIVLNHQNNRQSTVLYNTSTTPVSSCTPLDAGQCDKNDPYGSCYQPPNDGCTRLADGSITCPDNADPPKPQATCGGATYCNRPPTGCGTGYVSGSYNGQAICIKSSPSTGTGDGSGTGTGDGSGTGVNTGTGSTNISNTSNSSSTSNTTTTNNSTGGTGEGGSTGGSTATTTTTMTIDFTPVVRAISALSDKMTWVKSEIVNAVSRVEDKLTQTNSKLDTANSKLDSVKASVDQTTAAVNANAASTKTAVDANTAATNAVKNAVDANTNSTNGKLNDVINAINNKPVGGGGGGTTDMQPTNDLLTDIKNFLTGEVDTSSLEAELPTQEVSNQTLDTGYFRSSPSCPPDVSLVLPALGSYTFSYAKFCDALQIAGYLIMIAAYMFAALIVSKA